MISEIGKGLPNGEFESSILFESPPGMANVARSTTDGELA
jgi:hypothetical protein